MAFDLSPFQNLDSGAAERLAGTLNVEFHPIVCEYVNGGICSHVSPEQRETAVSVAADENRVPAHHELPGAENTRVAMDLVSAKTAEESEAVRKAIRERVSDIRKTLPEGEEPDRFAAVNNQFRESWLETKKALRDQFGEETLSAASATEDVTPFQRAETDSVVETRRAASLDRDRGKTFVSDIPDGKPVRTMKTKERDRSKKK